jgi:hypothetical protein
MLAKKMVIFLSQTESTPTHFLEEKKALPLMLQSLHYKFYATFLDLLNAAHKYGWKCLEYVAIYKHFHVFVYRVN